MSLVVLLIILLLLFGGGGFYLGGPRVGGSLGGLILLILIASSIPSDSAKCPARRPAWTCFQVFPLSAVLKKPLSVPMKIAPPAVSKALRIRGS